MDERTYVLGYQQSIAQNEYTLSGTLLVSRWVGVPDRHIPVLPAESWQRVDEQGFPNPQGAWEEARDRLDCIYRRPVAQVS